MHVIGDSILKLKLEVSKNRYDALKTELNEKGIEIDDNADLILSEKNRFADNLTVKEPDSNERVILPTEEIVLIESFGHTIEVHTDEKKYVTQERLYKIINLLNPEKFLRISNSSVIAKERVKKISPTLSMKYILTMSNGRTVDVTRSYYYIFKEYFGI